MAAAPTQADRDWHRLLEHLLESESDIMNVTRDLARLPSYRTLLDMQSKVVAQERVPRTSFYNTIEDILELRKDARSQAPDTLEAPVSQTDAAEATRILTKRDRCSHTMPLVEAKPGHKANKTPAIRKYQEGKNGWYAQCQMCSRKWHWQINQWEICDEEKLHKAREGGNNDTPKQTYGDDLFDSPRQGESPPDVTSADDRRHEVEARLARNEEEVTSLRDELRAKGMLECKLRETIAANEAQIEDHKKEEQRLQQELFRQQAASDEKDLAIQAGKNREQHLAAAQATVEERLRTTIKESEDRQASLFAARAKYQTLELELQGSRGTAAALEEKVDDRMMIGAEHLMRVFDVLGNMKEGLDDIRRDTEPMVYLFEGLNGMKASLDGVRDHLNAQGETQRQSVAELRELVFWQGEVSRQILSMLKETKAGGMDRQAIQDATASLAIPSAAAQARGSSTLTDTALTDQPNTTSSSSSKAATSSVEVVERAISAWEGKDKETYATSSSSRPALEKKAKSTTELGSTEPQARNSPRSALHRSQTAKSAFSHASFAPTEVQRVTYEVPRSSILSADSISATHGSEAGRNFTKQLSLCSSPEDDVKLEGKQGLRDGLEDLETSMAAVSTTQSNKGLAARIAKYQHQVEEELDAKSSIDTRKGVVALNSRRLSAFFRGGNAKGPESRRHRCPIIKRIAEHPAFEVGSACVIITHSLFIGAYVHYMATVSMNGHIVFTVGNTFLTCCFFTEVMIKAIAEGTSYVYGPEARWNWFDITLLSLVVGEVTLRVLGIGSKGAKKALKIAELIRTTRILRIFRFLKFSESLSVIISKIFASVSSLAWILAMMSMMMFVVAVSVTTGSLYILHGDGTEPEPMLTPTLERLDHYFGNVTASMFSIFASVSGGLVWADLVDIMAEMGLFYQVLFVCFMALITFAFLNLITGIFVDNATQADAELVRTREAKKRSEQWQILRGLFNEIDSSGVGYISSEEFVEFASRRGQGEFAASTKTSENVDKRGKSFAFKLEGIGLTMTEGAANSLFKLLDQQDNGVISVDEFVEGLLHLRGNSSALDMKMLLMNVRHLRNSLLAFDQASEDKLKQRMKDLKMQVQALDNNLKVEIQDLSDGLRRLGSRFTAFAFANESSSLDRSPKRSPRGRAKTDSNVTSTTKFSQHPVEGSSSKLTRPPRPASPRQASAPAKERYDTNSVGFSDQISTWKDTASAPVVEYTTVGDESAGLIGETSSVTVGRKARTKVAKRGSKSQR